MTVPSKRLLTRPLLFFMLTMILANIAGFMFRPYLPLFLESLGASIENIGLFFTLSAIAPLFFQIFGGWLSDRIGRLQAIAIGSVAGVVSHIVYVIAPSWEWLLAASVFGAMTSAFVRPSYEAFIAEQSTEENRGRVYGISETLFAIVGIVGPPIGGYLVQGLSFRSMFVASAALYAVAAMIRIGMALNAMRNDTRTAAVKAEHPSLRSSIAEMAALIAIGGVVTWIFISDGVLDSSMNFSYQLVPLYMENLHKITPIEIGWLGSITAVSTMAVVGFGGWLSDRMGEHVGITLGIASFALSFVVMSLGVSFIGFAISFALLGIGEALDRPAYQALISKVVPLRLRGIAFGIFATSTGIIALPMPYLGSLAYERISPVAPFLIVGGILTLLLPIVWTRLRVPKSEVAEAGAPT